MQLQFKKQPTICAILLCFSAISVPLTSQAVTVTEVPNPRRINNTWVTDNANILSDSTEVQLNQMISDLEVKNGSEIAVVTVTDTKPSATPKAFATELFNFWGIGKKGKNNGVLLLISSGERRVQIETGSGIQSILPDAKTVRIIETDITPRFKQQDFNGGTLAGTKALVNLLQTPANVQSQTALPFAPIVPSQAVQPSPIPSQSPVISNSTSTGEESSNPIYGLLWFLLIPFLALIIVLIVCSIILKMFLGLFSRKLASLRHRYPHNYSSNTPSYTSNNRNYSSSNNHNYCGAGGDYTINNIDYSSSSSSDDCSSDYSSSSDCAGSFGGGESSGGGGGGDYSSTSSSDDCSGDYSSSSDCAGSFGGGESSGGGGGGDYSSTSSSDYSCSSSDYSSSSSSSSDSSGGGGGGDW